MTEQLMEAGVLLAVGMSVVFAFLTLLIGGIHSIAWFANLFPYPQKMGNDNSPKYSQNKNNITRAAVVNPTIVAAISAAVHQHRRNTK